VKGAVVVGDDYGNAWIVPYGTTRTIRKGLSTSLEVDIWKQGSDVNL
jgi:hypothetical protein